VNDILQINKIEDNRIVLESLTFNISDEIEMKSSPPLAKTNANEIIVILMIASRVFNWR
jgi:hypothetical protein